MVLTAADMPATSSAPSTGRRTPRSPDATSSAIFRARASGRLISSVSQPATSSVTTNATAEASNRVRARSGTGSPASARSSPCTSSHPPACSPVE